MIEVAVAILGLAGVIARGLFGIRKETIKNQILHQEILDRMKVVERKIDIHNGYAEKFASCNKALGVMGEKINNMEEKVNVLFKSK